MPELITHVPSDTELRQQQLITGVPSDEELSLRYGSVEPVEMPHFYYEDEPASRAEASLVPVGNVMPAARDVHGYRLDDYTPGYKAFQSNYVANGEREVSQSAETTHHKGVLRRTAKFIGTTVFGNIANKFRSSTKQENDAETAGIVSVEPDVAALIVKDIESNAVDSEQLYGQERSRFELFKKLSYGQFKRGLIAINREVITKNGDTQHDDGFTQNERYIGAGNSLVKHIMPDHRDTDAVLEYALQRAKNANDMQDAAFVMGVGVVMAHPFSDGNGRSSRRVYAELSAGVGANDSRTDAIGAATGQNETTGRQLIELGSSFTNNFVIKTAVEKRIAELSGYEKSTRLFAHALNYDKSETGTYYGLPEAAGIGLDESQKMWLEDAYREARGLGYDYEHLAPAPNFAPLAFAIAKAEKLHPEVMKQFVEPETGAVNLQSILHDTKAVEIRGAIADGGREYYENFAKAAIDLASNEYGGKKYIETEQGKISIRDYIIEQSNNFLAEKIGKKVPMSTVLQKVAL